MKSPKEKNLVPPFSSQNQPSPEARARAARTRRLKRDPLTECLRDFLTDGRLRNDGVPGAQVLKDYNPNTIAIVSAMVRIAKADLTDYEDLKPGQAIQAVRDAQRDIFCRIAGLPPRAHVEAADWGDDVQESVTLIDRPREVTLPIPDSEVGRPHDQNGNGHHGNGNGAPPPTEA